jgi:hypothetical protein
MALSLWSSLVVSLVCGSGGMRIARHYEQVSVASKAALQPISRDCFLAGGFGIQKGCQYVQAMQSMPDCTSASIDEACIEESDAEQYRGYLRDVRTSSDYSSLVRSVTEAEGGGFGVSVSSSFSYLERSQVGERSIAFFIGGSGLSKVRSIRNPLSMKLTPAAKDLLTNDPRRFTELHGLKYVYSINYGGSFLGSFTLNSRNTSDVRDMEAFASVSVNSGLFSVSGQTDFQNTLEQQSSSISTFAGSDWKGGSGINIDYNTPAGMGNMFSQWDRSWRSSPEPLNVVTRRWIDSEEVQVIVHSMSPEDMALFYDDDISPVMQREISEENAKIMRLEHSVELALSWPVTDSVESVRTCFSNLRRELVTQRLHIDTLNDTDVLAIQRQWSNNDQSWFVSDQLSASYANCMSLVGDSEDVSAHRREGFEQVWDLAEGACWHAANNHAGRKYEKDAIKDLEVRDLALLSMKSNFRGNSQLENFAESMKETAQDYAWYANDQLHGHRQDEQANYDSYQAHSHDAMTFLSHDVLYGALEGMVTELCWSAARTRRYGEEHSEAKALHHKHEVIRILDEISLARAWPLYEE